MSVEAPPDRLLRPLMPLYRGLLERIGPIGTLDPSARVTSWYRDSAENRAVGGHPDSQHLFGFAVDIVTAEPSEVVRLARSFGLEGVEEFDHVHLQIFPAGFLRTLGLFR